LLAGSAAYAQSSIGGGIAGVVKDSTGAVLPGVTVEAASPALIEKSRTAVTDAQGNYKLVDLRPGTYTVTFSLQGFGTSKHEGIELAIGFTAAVNAELKVGAVEQSVTVTGASPIVDVQNVRTQNLLSREALDELPTSRTQYAMTALTLGATTANPGAAGPQDVGGSLGEGNAGISIHGSRVDDHHMFLDGMNFAWAFGNAGGNAHTYSVNQWITQEVTLETAGTTAEAQTSGAQVNFVPKDGGNSFRGTVSGNFANDSLQSGNLDDALRARGLTTASGIRKIYDVGGGFGGPVLPDRLWFYIAQRKWLSSSYRAGVFFNSTVGTPIYTPDPSRPGYSEEPGHDTSARVTWQATPKQKVAFFESYRGNCLCFTFTGLSTPEAAYNAWTDPTYLTQGTWSYTATNKLLMQGGVTILRTPVINKTGGGGTNSAIPIQDLGTGLVYNAHLTSPFVLTVADYGISRGDQENSRFSVSYVTGSHAFKFGFQNYLGFHSYDVEMPQLPGLGPVAYQFLNGRPAALILFASPLITKDRGHNVSLYAQDQWTVQRLTLNLGLRFDYNHQWVPEQTIPGGAFYPSAHFDYVDANDWKDISPRIGAAYDLFGNGKTAVKVSVGRYLASNAVLAADFRNPALSLVTATTRTWNDANGDLFPQGNPNNPAANGELGPLTNPFFGTAVAPRTWDPAILNGWGARPYNWQWSASVTHELRPGLGVQVGYYRTSFGNFWVTDNLAITRADFDPYCITTPTDSRLPGGGGQQICGQYDLKPAALGKISNYVTSASNFGDQSEVYNGLEFIVNARFGKGGRLSGGVSTASTHTNACYVVDSPQQLFDCDIKMPWSAQTQVKFSGSYPLPYGFLVSGVFQNIPGFAQQATLAVPNAQIAPSLGRNLSACGALVVCTAVATVGSVPSSAPPAIASPYLTALGSGGILPPYSQFEDRMTQVDLRFGRTFAYGHVRVQPQLDLYNLFNANTVLSSNTTYGAAWLRPTAILTGRFVKFGAQIDF
jgi:hypothetical protein